MIRCKRLAMSILSTAAIVLGCTWLGTPAVRAQEKPLREQLVGAWTLVSIEVTSRDGNKRPGLGGPNAKGILILDVSGRYAQVTGDPVRPKLTATARKDIPAAELGEAARTFGARYGAWSVNEADRTLTQTSELPMIAEEGRTGHKSSISVEGSELKLVEAQAEAKVEFVFRRPR